MKPFKATLTSISACLLIYLAFCFGQASFDITHWPADLREHCALYMLLFGAMGFCTAKSLE